MTSRVSGYETSWQQKETWLAGQAGQRNLVQALLRIDGPVSEGDLVTAWEKVLTRHAILRTRFVRSGGRRYPIQVVNDAAASDGERRDLAGLDEARQERAMAQAAVVARAGLPEPDGLRAPRVDLFALGGGRHAVLLTVHPLQADRESLVDLAAELAGALAVDGAPDEGSLQYIQFSQWQQEVLDGADEAVVGTESPQVWPGTVAGNADGRGEFRTSLSGDAARDLCGFARRHDVTVEAVLLAAYHVLLARQFASTAPPLSVYRSGRGHEELDGAIGPYAFHAAMAFETDSGQSLAELAVHVQEQLSAIDGSVALPPQGSGRSAPCAFEYHDLPEPFRAGPASVSVLWATTYSEPRGLRLVVERRETATGPEFTFVWAHDRRLLSDAYVPRLADRHLTLLTAAVQGTPSPVGDLPRLGRQERHDLLFGLQGDTAPAAVGLAHSLVEAQAARTPDHTAVVEGQRSLSYAGLLREATGLATRLRQLGIGPGDRVGIRIGHALELPSAILAVLRTGAAFVPIDPTHPAQRALDLLTQARCTMLVTSAGNELPDFQGGHIVLGNGADGALPTSAATAHPEPGIPLAGPDDLAYIMFTSGSTGRPKGVMVHHSALANYLAWSADAYLDQGSGSSVVHSSIGFDLTVTSLLTPLVAGRTVRLLADAPRDPLALSRALVEHDDIDFVKLTPSHLRLLNGQSTRERMADRAVTLVIGGEALTADDLAPWDGARVINEYGPTETVVGCTAAQWSPERHGIGAVPIGRPIAGTRVHVLDGTLSPVPVGTPGEVYIGGAGVAQGYYDDPARTAEQFVPDPFSPVPGGRLYRSQDIACHLPDGELRYLGRADAQIKVRGIRVEPEEVRSQLLRHPGVQGAAVVARRLDEGDSELIAFVVTVSGAAVPPSQLREFLAQHAPAHLIPAAIHALDELPLNANGKTDTDALLTRANTAIEQRDGGGDTPAPPRDDIELRLLTIFEELLKRTGIGVHDDFFDLGGHSLLVVQLVAAMENVFGTAVPLQALFDEDAAEAATVAGLARALRGRTSDGAAPDRLLCLQRHGELTPLVLVHPGGGEVLGYRQLARGLGPHRPVYAFQHPPVSTGPELQSDVLGLADTYRATLLERLPQGPYLLAGWSFGGAVAFEMARGLRAAGHRVDQVILLDSYLRTPEPSPSELLAGFADEWGKILGGRIPVSEEFLGSCTLEEGVRHVVQRAEDYGLISAGQDNDYILRRFELYRAHGLALHDYRPSPAPGTVTLIQAADSAEPEREETLVAWRSLTDGVFHHIVPGDHFSMMREPHVDDLCALLEQVLGEH
ncbi:amino acid adenylation domain-containing protein [Streptomyces sp. NPDC052701]|uniref:non-ribosomal peptide synthetase n=1 Tax=Streptomyces sp. NPDC052701 TaxID=3155533 RepID=UPI003438D5D6